MILETTAEPLVCRYRWTEEEAWKVSRYHWRKNFRWPFRWLTYFILGAILILSSWSLLNAGVRFSSLALFVASAYFLCLRRFEARWWHRRRFRHRPDRDKLLEYGIADEGISSQVEGLGESRVTWASVFKVLRAPDGFLLYPNEHIMYWLPRAGFSSADAMEALDRLLRAKVPRYSSL